MVYALSTGHQVGLAATGIVFIAFALLSSFWFPRRNPNFPGRGLAWFVLASLALFAAMITAVLVFGVEEKEGGEPAGIGVHTTATASAAAAPAKGDAAAGKKVFGSAGCTGCHTLKAAGSSGNVGPNLDEAKPDAGLIRTRVEHGKGPMPPFAEKLSAQEIDDVVAFVYSSTHS